ncbi:MAG: hypothetical protein EOP52_09945 [Sphingobacteriales bacterium]|nr:MAG: hypothetical protein EOP52_09945 [Sphingobacteriales bacterium]
MQFFAAQLIYQYCSDAAPKAQYAIELRMIHAADEPAAIAEARRIGESHLQNAFRKFIGVKSIEEVHLDNGALLFQDTREFRFEPVAS